MITYIIRRSLLTIPVVLLVVFAVFLLMRLLPGDAVDLLLEDSPYVRDEDRVKLREQLGLDKSVSQQFVIWLGSAIKGDFGTSIWTGQTISDVIQQRIEPTLQLVVMAMIVGVLIGIPSGIVAAAYQHTPIDIGVRFIAIVGLTVPNFVLGTAVLVYASRWFNWAPPLGYVSILESPERNLQQMFLPALVLGFSLSASSMRMMRSQMLETLRMDYVRTARAKGQKERIVVVSHGARNAINPVITIIGNQVAFLIGGSLIMEVLFGIPGMGRTLYDGITNRDYPLIQAIVTLTAMGLVAINLLVDLSYGLFDPRIRYGR